MERVLEAAKKWDGTLDRQATLDEIMGAVFGREDDDDA